MENNEITLETLPKAFTQFTKDVNEKFRLLLEKSNQPQIQTDLWFDLRELCNYIPDKPAKPTVYGWITRNEIPYHKRAKKLYFLKSEIDAWLKIGRKKTLAEIATEADLYLETKKRLNNGK